MAKKKNEKLDKNSHAIIGFVQELVNDAVDTILTGMQNIQDQNNKRFDRLEKGQKRLETRTEKLDKGQEDIKEKLNDMTLTYPSREEFDALKKKVLRHHPSN